MTTMKNECTNLHTNDRKWRITHTITTLINKKMKITILYNIVWWFYDTTNNNNTHAHKTTTTKKKKGRRPKGDPRRTRTIEGVDATKRDLPNVSERRERDGIGADGHQRVQIINKKIYIKKHKTQKKKYIYIHTQW